jgi:hypothetical protein
VRPSPPAPCRYPVDERRHRRVESRVGVERLDGWDEGARCRLAERVEGAELGFVLAADRAGNDAEADIGGAMAAGLKTVLVRTGKYRPGDEKGLQMTPDRIGDDLAYAVAWILGECRDRAL